MFSKFDEKAKKVLVNMRKEMVDLKHPYVGSEHLFLSLLKYGDKDYVDKFYNLGITYSSFRNELIRVVGVGKSNNTFFLYTPLLRNVLESARLGSSDRGKNVVDTKDLFLALFEEGEGVAIRILMGMDIDVDSLYDEFYISKKSSNKLTIDLYGIDLNEKSKSGKFDPVVCRDREISRVLEILSRRTKNNPLLLGDAGVGKTAIVEELARRLSIGDVPFLLLDKKIVSISMAELVAGTKYRGEFEEKLTKIISELEDNPNTILFIDEIHTLVGAGGAEGAIDASNILKPFLARGDIRVIGATTMSEYKETIEKDKALSRRFQTVVIKEPSLDDAALILKKLRPIYEEYHGVKISDEIISEIVNLSDKYIYNKRFPDKAIDVMDEVCSRKVLSLYKNYNVDNLSLQLTEVRNLKNTSIVNNNFDDAFLYKKTEMILEDKKNRLELKKINNRSKKITLSDVYKTIQDMSNIPIFRDINFVNKYKNKLCKNIKGQDNAISLVCDTFKKKYYSFNSIPISFLFVGSTGVGKTLLAKEYGKCFYDNNVIKVDMSEYKENHSISKMIGSPPGYVGYDDNKNLFEKVKDNPYSLIILDEIEKGSKEVINLFLQILDEGFARNSKGDKIDFSHTTIIMTSNLGANHSSIGFETKANFSDINKFFGIEFINRINSVIYFNKIDFDVCNDIVLSFLNELKKKYRDNGVWISFSRKIVSEIIDMCEYNIFGARKIKSIIQNNIENLIIENIGLGLNKIKIESIKKAENV